MSHDKTAIQSVCDHIILLNAGRVARKAAGSVLDFYNAMLTTSAKPSSRKRERAAR
jgi:ABC-type polysaccharide/polyol phosphate transport system ATPase subunit